MLSLRSSALLVLWVALSGCPRETGASDDYAAAAKLWTAALQELGDDAAADPRADEALALARKVSADSIDSEAAKALVTRIEEAVREHAAREAYRAAPVEVEPAREDPSPLADSEVEAPAASVEPPPSLPEVGSSEADFRTRYGACVAFDRPFLEAGGSKQGEAWALATSAGCREKHPELDGKHVFLLGGKVYNVAPLSAAVKVVQNADGSWQPESGKRPPGPAAGADEKTETP